MNRALTLALRPIAPMLRSNVRTNSSLVQATDGAVSRRITMSNLKQRNSLGIDMIRALQAAVDSTNFEQCRVLVLSSADDKIFSAGHNLKELTTEKGAQLHEQVFAEFTQLCLRLQKLPVPVIAEVKGLAAAAGLQLAASCDIIVASRHASFSTPGVKFGVFCTTPGVALSRNISHKVSAKMLFTGEPISAQLALQHGLISEVVDDNELGQEVLREQVDTMCRKIGNNSKSIISLGKEAFYEQISKGDISDAYEVGCRAMVENLEYEDTQLGLKAFANKEKPVWLHSPNKVKN